MNMRKVSLLLAFSFAILIPAFGQDSSAALSLSPKIDNEFVHQQFGKEFTFLPEFAPSVGDLDGDGVEDVVIAARCKNPMLDQGEHNYMVMDPFNDFFGYGDPRMTTTFSEGDPTNRGLVMLVIAGAGKDAWHSATPKAKFVLVNLPYKTITVRKMHTRKKNIEAIYIEEAGEMGNSSALYFDGKKFRYVPMGGDMQ
jgi:hypothetical protein